MENKIKAITPKDMTENTSNLDRMIDDINKQLESSKKGLSKYHIDFSFFGKYNNTNQEIEMCKKISKIYRDAGWENVEVCSGGIFGCRLIKLFSNKTNSL